MEIHILDLDPKRDVEIKGDEAWLAPIYQDFTAEKDSNLTSGERITGNLVVEKLTDDIIRVTGGFTYTPLVDCSRCAKRITWPLKLTVEVYYQRRGQADLPKDVSLTKGELDEYYFEGESIDITEVVNDTIQLALPSRYLPLSDDGTSCNICEIDISEPQIYGTPETEDEEESPFSVLKSFKPKH